MKKLLATLLVAAMLISCMSVIAFADATSTVSTVANPLNDDFYYFDEDDGFTSLAMSDYASFVEDVNSLTNNTKKKNFAKAGTDPLYTFIYNSDPEAEEIRTYSVDGGVYVQVPVYADGVGSVDGQFRLNYDKTKFSYVGNTFPSGTGTDQSYGTKIAWSNGSDGTIVGFVGAAYFSVLSDDIANETFTISFVAPDCFNAGDKSVCGTGNLVMTVNPAAVVEKEDITAAEMPATEVPAFTASAADDAAWLATANVVNGDDVDVDLENGTYTAAFGNTANYDSYNTPDKFGIALYADGELKGYYEAKNIIEGKFGILFFGLKDGVEYTMKNYVQYGEGAPIVAK